MRSRPLVSFRKITTPLVKAAVPEVPADESNQFASAYFNASFFEVGFYLPDEEIDLAWPRAHEEPPLRSTLLTARSPTGSA